MGIAYGDVGGDAYVAVGVGRSNYSVPSIAE